MASTVILPHPHAESIPSDTLEAWFLAHCDDCYILGELCPVDRGFVEHRRAQAAA